MKAAIVFVIMVVGCSPSINDPQSQMAIKSYNKTCVPLWGQPACDCLAPSAFGHMGYDNFSRYALLKEINSSDAAKYSKGEELAFVDCSAKLTP